LGGLLSLPPPDGFPVVDGFPPDPFDPEFPPLLPDPFDIFSPPIEYEKRISDKQEIGSVSVLTVFQEEAFILF